MKKVLFSFARNSGLIRLMQRIGAGENGLYVLAYHRVGAPSVHDSLDPGLVNAWADPFAAQMDLLVRGYRPVDMEEVLRSVRSGTRLPRNAVLVTFDDGYRDFGELAFPILQERGIRPLLFVASGCVGEDRFWWDQLYRLIMDPSRSEISSPFGLLPLDSPESRRELLARWLDYAREEPFETVRREISSLWDAVEAKPDSPPVTLNWDDLRRLDRLGVSVAPHSHSHPILSHLPLESARREIRLSRQRIEEEIGHVPPVFAYPDGKKRSVSPGLGDILREEGFELAFTMIEGRARLDRDPPLMLPRIGTMRSWSLAEFHARLTPFYDRWKRSWRR